MKSDNRRARTRWACRRGMKELDLLLIPFFEACYDGLSAAQVTKFEHFLTHTDPELYGWLMKKDRIDHPDIQYIVNLVLDYAKNSSGLSTL